METSGPWGCRESEQHPVWSWLPHQARKCLWVGFAAAPPGAAGWARVRRSSLLVSENHSRSWRARETGRAAGPRGRQHSARDEEPAGLRGAARQPFWRSESTLCSWGRSADMLGLGRGHPPQSSTRSKPLQPLHYLLQGLMGTATAGFCSAAWSGGAAQLARTQGQGLLREGGKPPCVAVFVDLPHVGLTPAHSCPHAVPSNTCTSPLSTPTPRGPPKYGYLTSAHSCPTQVPQVHSPPSSSLPAPRESSLWGRMQSLPHPP